MNYIQRIKIFFLLSITFFERVEAKDNPSAIIEGVFHSTDKIDTIQLQYFQYYFFSLDKQHGRIFTCIAHNGKFKFRLTGISSLGYFKLNLSTIHKNNKLLDLYLLEAGDSVFVNATNPIILFSGRGSEKFQCRYTADTVQIEEHTEEEIQSVSDGRALRTTDNLFEYSLIGKKRLDSLLAERLSIVEKFNAKISPGIIAQLKTDYIGDYYFNFFYRARLIFHMDPDTSASKIAMFRFYNKFLKDFTVDISDSKTITKSRSYVDFLLSREKLEATLISSGYKTPIRDYKFGTLYNLITEKYTGSIREKMLTSAFEELFTVVDSVDEYLPVALTIVKEHYFKEVLQTLATTKLKGSKVYPFHLKDQFGKTVRLSDFKGKIVIIHFWYTGCGACRLLGIGLQKVSHDLSANRQLVFLTVNIDKDLREWKESLKKGIYTSPEEINLNTGPLGDDHPFIKYYQITSFPELFIIDRNGKIFSTHPQWPWNANTEKVRIFEAQLNDALQKG
jgi:peroxiredoxin